MTKKRIIAFLCFVTLLCVFITPLSPASADTRTLIIINETEPNNTYVGADQTYDDYNNYGALTTSSDVDWWTVTFTSEGIANFWLGKVPSGCNYNLKVYGSDGSSLIVRSERTSNSQELCKIHVRSGETYYIKIYSESGYSSTNYKMRVKNYPLRDAEDFTTTVGINTRQDAVYFLSHVWSMGFGGQEYLNNSAAGFYNDLPLTDIIVESNHGIPGRATFYNSYLYGNSFSGMGTQNRAVSAFSSNALSDTKLVIYMCCYSGATDTSFGYGNLVDNTLEKGAFCCLGWPKKISNDHASIWLDKFMECVENSGSVGDALEDVDHWMQTYHSGSDWDDMRIYYVGSSRLYAIKLG